MMPPSLPTRRQAYGSVLVAAFTVIVCAALMTAATFDAAPPVVIPFVVAVCIGLPIVMAWSVPLSLAVLRATRGTAAGDARALRTMRRSLSRLPETDHPLGL